MIRLAALCIMPLALRPVGTAEAQPANLAAAGDLLPVGLTVHSGLSKGRTTIAVDQSEVLESSQPFAEVSVGNPEIANVTPLTQQAVYVFGRKVGTTTLTMVDDHGRVTGVVDLVVTYDLGSLKRQLYELVPGATVEVRPAADGIVLSGNVTSAAQQAQVVAVANRYAPEKVTNLMQVTGSQQVMLAVRFAEISRSLAKELGFTNVFSVKHGDSEFRLNSGDGRSTSPLSFATGAVSLFTDGVRLQSLLDTLEQKGAVKTLAEPNLVALSGDTASFLAGGEFPVPVGNTTQNGTNQITIEFKQFGVSLSFTPTVITADLINLQLFTEVSEIDPNSSVTLDSVSIPGLKVRRAKTTIELTSGQGFAIAGLLQQNFTDAVRQFPILGDIPVLGALFRSVQYQTGQTELVVLVTPHLVTPTRPGSLAVPTDTFRAPSDADLFLFGRTEGAAVPRAADPGAVASGSTPLPEGGMARGLIGPHGYVLN